MSPKSYRFVQVDVFTDRIFRGNPLAVFLDGRGLDDGHMKATSHTWLTTSDAIYDRMAERSPAP